MKTQHEAGRNEEKAKEAAQREADSYIPISGFIGALGAFVIVCELSPQPLALAWGIAAAQLLACIGSVSLAVEWLALREYRQKTPLVSDAFTVSQFHRALVAIAMSFVVAASWATTARTCFLTP